MGDAQLSAGALHGRAILITRPRAQSGRLAALVRAADGEPVVFPTIEIEPLPPSGQALAALAELDRCQLAIFVSRNAVACGMPLVVAAGGRPDSLQIAAVGPGTARALHEQGVAAVLASSAGADSDALAALPDLQAIAGWRVLIFRGVGGRERLAQTLQARGAHVDYVECYRRAAPAADPQPLQARLRAAGLHAVTATSSEGLDNLVRCVGAELGPALRALPLFVIHANIAESARRQGFRTVQVTAPSDEGLVRGIISHFAPQEGRTRDRGAGRP